MVINASIPILKRVSPRENKSTLSTMILTSRPQTLTPKTQITVPQIITSGQRTLVRLIPFSRIHVVVRVPTIQDGKIVLMVTLYRCRLIMRSPVLSATEHKTRNRTTSTTVTLIRRRPSLKGKSVHMVRRTLPNKDDGVACHGSSVINGITRRKKSFIPSPSSSKGVSSTIILITT